MNPGDLVVLTKNYEAIEFNKGIGAFEWLRGYMLFRNEPILVLAVVNGHHVIKERIRQDGVHMYGFRAGQYFLAMSLNKHRSDKGPRWYSFEEIELK